MSPSDSSSCSDSSCSASSSDSGSSSDSFSYSSSDSSSSDSSGSSSESSSSSSSWPVFDYLGAYRCECGEECYGGATATEPLELPSDGTQGGFDPSLGLPLVSGIGLPPQAGARLPLDTGLVYDPTGGATGAGFGGSWLCGGLAGLRGAGGSSPASAPVYYRGPNRAVAFDFNAAGGTYTTRYFSLQTLGWSGGGSSSESSSSESSSSESSSSESSSSESSSSDNSSSENSSSDSSSSSCGAAGYRLLEPCGRVVCFTPAGVVGSVAGSCSNVMNFSYGGDGRLQRIDVDLSSGSNSYVYTWSGGRITEVVYSVGTRPVRRLVYGYSVSGNDLQTIMEFENTAATGAPVWSSQPVSAMRFTYHSDGLLRHVVGPEQWRQMKANNPATTPDPATAPADDLNEYASAEYEYASGRVSKMYKNGRAFTYRDVLSGQLARHHLAQRVDAPHPCQRPGRSRAGLLLQPDRAVDARPGGGVRRHHRQGLEPPLPEVRGGQRPAGPRRRG